MLAIRLKRTGRKGHAQFRVIVQDAHRHPSSGNIVALLGSYNPHTKTAQLDNEKASFYLDHGAQPSDRAARLLKDEGVKLPKWVVLEPKKKGAIRSPEKLRKNRPAGAEAPPTKAEKAAIEETPAEAENNDQAAAETTAETPVVTENNDQLASEASPEKETETVAANNEPETQDESAAQADKPDDKAVDEKTTS